MVRVFTAMGADGSNGGGGEIYTGCQLPNNVIALYKLRESGGDAGATVEHIKAAVGTIESARASASINNNTPAVISDAVFSLLARPGIFSVHHRRRRRCRAS